MGVCFVEGTVNKEYECWVCDLKVLKSFVVTFKGVKCNRARSLYSSSLRHIWYVVGGPMGAVSRKWGVWGLNGAFNWS